MSPLARRGRLLYVVLATVLIASKLFGVGFHLNRVWTLAVEPQWIRSIVLPLIFVVMILGLRTGDRSQRWMVAIWLWISGALPVFAAFMMTARLAERIRPDEAGFFIQILGPALGVLALFGLVEIAIGCAILWLPSLKAYFDERRLASLIEVV